MKKRIIFCLLILLTSNIFSQITLPYYTGFDNASEQNGWVEYKKAETNFTGWNYSNSNSNSAPVCIAHDYSPSSGITLVDNWFVSPSFEIPQGGNLNEISYKFSGFSQPSVNDTIAIYLLQGSQDPDLATKILLFDFRNNEYITDNVYRTKTNINLQSFNGLSYFAIRYNNSNASSNWLNVFFDDITISENSNNVNQSALPTIKLFPNPTKQFIFINSNSIIFTNAKVYDISGKLISSKKIEENKINIGSLPNGFYILKLSNDKTSVTKKFIVKR